MKQSGWKKNFRFVISRPVEVLPPAPLGMQRLTSSNALGVINAIYSRSRELSKESHIADEVQALSQAAKGSQQIKIKKLGWANPARVNAKS